MVDSINSIKTGTAKYDITYQELDVNKDGVVNKNDYELLKGFITDDDETNDINVSEAELNDIFATVLSGEAEALTDCPNCKVEEPAENTTLTAGAKTDADVAQAATDLLAKYPVNNSNHNSIGQVDSYSMSNPEMAAFKTAIDDGAIAALAGEGFTPAQIVDVIAKAYPTIGISNNDQGGINCPYGHGEDAKALYESFITAINSVTSADASALKAEVKALNEQIAANNLQLNVLKGSIEKLQTEVETAIEEALKQSEEIAEDQKEEAATIVKEELDNYANSDGEMTYEQFQENLGGRLDNLQTTSGVKMSKVVCDIMDAESKMGTLKNYLAKFGSLVDLNKTIADQIDTKTGEIAEIESQPSEGCPVQRCDPIGFEAEGVQYDFFVDKDNNNDLSNEQEFLGAQNGWNEMAALDTNNDGKVTADEMQDLKVVATDAEGNQTVQNAADLFKENDAINLDSYKEVNEDFDNGNTLLGTFSLDFNGQEITDGYNTLDNISWLDENYNFTDKDNGINRFAKGNEKYLELNDFSKERDAFEVKAAELEQKLAEAWNNIGVERTLASEMITKSSKKSASAKAEEIENLFNTKKLAHTDDTTQVSNEENNEPIEEDENVVVDNTDLVEDTNVTDDAELVDDVLEDDIDKLLEEEI